MPVTRIIILVENTASARGLLGEHGFAAWVEAGGRRILFDTGQGRALAPNADRLGCALAEVDAVVLSHGHYDHTGALAEVLDVAARPRVYAHPEAFTPKFARNAGGGARPVGVPGLTEADIRARAELIPVESPIEIAEGVRLTGPIPRTTDYEDTGGAFFRDAACTIPDPLIDDQAAFLETPAGTVVLLGCAHAGVINTLHYIRELTGGAPIDTVVGGMHLLHADAERMERTLADLGALEVARLRPCHCTGFEATARLWQAFPGRCSPAPAGTAL